MMITFNRLSLTMRARSHPYGMTRIYIDITDTHANWLNTGIQRTVRNIARYMPELAPNYGCIAEPVVFSGASISLIDANKLPPVQHSTTLCRRIAQRTAVRLVIVIDAIRGALVAISPSPIWTNFVLAPRYRPGLSWLIVQPFKLLRHIANHVGRTIGYAEPSGQSLLAAVRPGDILLLADSTWARTDVWPAVTEFCHRGGRVVMIVYDLIPISHPEFPNRAVVAAFSRWIQDSVALVDYYACISRNTEMELVRFLRSLPVASAAGSLPASGYFHLGSDLDLAKALGKPSPDVQDIVASSAAIFLAVGSLEPRKNLSFALDAFERVWERDSQARLVIVGHNSWKVDELIERIQRHPLRGASLFWLRDASDTDLEHLYRRATALVFASLIEGFGLPLVEAMQRGLPVICSDIPVLREIADGKATFFSLDNPNQLTRILFATIDEHAMSERPRRVTHSWLSWRESTDILLRNICTQLLPERMKNNTASSPDIAPDPETGEIAHNARRL
jgi:glycosyltransferase involved in cell wall biosynthesis